ncbi:MAG TPA: translocation/assembly module TamB domain-containing protein, partial [Candidatus Udaeobacter sp.]|nr:translocation/assembly module TamB domain-containing protein [Candidatus Udaeobacter sp.]
MSARVSAIADSVRAPRAGAHLHQVELAVAADPHTGGVTDLSCRLVAETALLDRTAVPPGPLTLAAHGRKTNGTIAATIDTLALAGVAELQAPLAIRHRQRVLTLEGLDLAVAGGRVQGGFTQEPGRRGITCDLEEIDLAQVVALAGLDSVTSPSAADTTRRPAIAGRLSAKLALTDPGSGLLGKLALQGEELVLGAWPTPPLALALTSEVAPSTVVCNLQLAADDDSLVVRGTIPITRPNQVPHLAWDSPALDLEVHAAGDSLTPYLGRVLATIANTQPFAERLRKRLATTGLNLAVQARGRPRDPAIEVALDLDLAPLSPLGPGSLHLTAKRPADTLAVAAELAVEGMAAPLTLTAQAPLAMDLEQRAVAVPKTAPIAGTLDLSGFDLRLLDAFEESEFEGLLTVLGRLSGTRAAPDVTGRLSLADGEIKWKPLGLELDSLAVSAELAEQELRLHSASGRTKKGHVRMQGALPLTGDPEAGVKLEAEVTGLSIRTPEAVKAAGDAKLTVSGTIAEPVLEGKLTITEASIPLPEKGRKEMVKIPPDDPWLKGTRVAPGSRPPLTGQKLPIALNVTIDVPRNLWLRNDDINVEIGGTLKLTTPDGSLRVEGDLKTREGSVRMLNRRFQVTKGTVNFFGTRTLLPTIDIEAETQVRDNLVKIHLTGTVEEPKLDFASEPSHTESDIVSLLLFGRTSGELSSGETNFVQEQAGTVAASYVSAQLEREVGQKLKLDVLEIQAAEGNERVAVGKYVSSNTLLRAYQEMGTESYGGV